MSHHLSEPGDGLIKPEFLLSSTNNQTCREGSSPLSVLSLHAVPLHGMSQRCCIKASLVESYYFLDCLREMKLFQTLATSSVVMAELYAGFQKPFIALKCISNIFVLNMRVDSKGKWWSFFFARVLRHLCVTPAGIYLKCSAHFPKNHPQVLTTSAKISTKP